jgi:ubiquinone/menaquinone biosynthesis C-methylase UbiE
MRLVDGYPGLESLATEWYETHLAEQDEPPQVDILLGYLDRLIVAERFLVVGCGPRPETMRALRNTGFTVTGVEPVPQFAKAARQHLADNNAVIEGTAEHLPVKSESQDVVLLESVLEHVDSVEKTLAEAWRVLAPGGVAVIETTNRRRIGGFREEFDVPFFPWLPAGLKEAYIFQHLHQKPSLASYTVRPAVHWFTFPELCALGREAGFFQFYSRLDLKTPAEGLKGKLLVRVQKNAWLRALALSQRGGAIFMVKRDQPPTSARV